MHQECCSGGADSPGFVEGRAGRCGSGFALELVVAFGRPKSFSASSDSPLTLGHLRLRTSSTGDFGQAGLGVPRWQQHRERTAASAARTLAGGRGEDRCLRSRSRPLKQVLPIVVRVSQLLGLRRTRQRMRVDVALHCRHSPVKQLLRWSGATRAFFGVEPWDAPDSH
jgi:hypothetical protein